MKYYVQVNRCWMITTEAESALRAEHEFLDLDGVQFSNAFSDEDRKTDTFRGALLACETISRAELEKLSASYREAWKNVARTEEAAEAARLEVLRLKEALADAESRMQAAIISRDESKLKAIQAKQTIGLKEDD